MIDKKSNFRICLFEPRIPQNTGNIARTCAAFKLPLDIIKPIGFSLEDKYLRRAGLDYWEYVEITVHDSFNEYISYFQDEMTIVGCSKYGGNSPLNYSPSLNNILLFGREDIGLPLDIRNQCTEFISIPMIGEADNDGKNGVRSLNIAVSCGIIGYIVGSKLKMWS